MHAHEARGIEPPLEAAQALAHHMRVRADMHRAAIVVGLDPIDILQPHHDDAMATANEPAIARRTLGQERLQRQRRGLSAEAQLGTAQRLVEARLAARLEQIVDGVDLEGAQGKLVIGGDEQDRRHGRAHALDHVKAVEFGHLHVEDHQVRRPRLDRGDGLEAVAALLSHAPARMR